MGKYKVYCPECDSTLGIFDDQEPPEMEISYWGSKETAIRNWSAKSAAKGEKDHHNSHYYYGEERFHSATMEVIEE